MRILIATDAWRPQVNGVVRTYERLAEELGVLEVEAIFLTPTEFYTLPCPTYPEIRLALPGFRRVARALAHHELTDGRSGARCPSLEVPGSTHPRHGPGTH